MIRYIRENNEQIKEMPLECIEGATLLSINEAERFMTKDQRGVNSRWWLSTPGYQSDSVCYVYGDGDIDYSYRHVTIPYGVRPALRICNIKSSNLNIGDKFEFGEHSFTILSNDLAICDDFIAKSCFRRDYKTKDANIYEKSDVKKVVDDWFEEAYLNKNLGVKSDQNIFSDEDWGF